MSGQVARKLYYKFMGAKTTPCLWHLDMLNNLFRHNALFLSKVMNIAC